MLEAFHQLEAYFRGERQTFDLPLNLRGTPFQQEVWAALRKIPYGTTLSYGKLAATLGRPVAARAVGSANNRNPLPIFIPCHRVIGADGNLVGYLGGLDWKRRLLALERAFRKPSGDDRVLAVAAEASHEQTKTSALFRMELPPGRAPTDAQWAAVVRCDADADGRFWYAVRSTGIYCRPSCRSKQPLREGISLFDSIEDAGRAGYRPCKRCRPDLAEYEPVRALAEEAKRLCETLWADDEALRSALSALPVTQRHLLRIFKDTYGCTPAGHIANLRVEQAKAWLISSESRDGGEPRTFRTVTDIAHLCGFGSLSSFYAHFRKRTGMSPVDWRTTSGKMP